ncbi:MAG TPA: response regulator [Thermoanaerobaculia bacterium]|nr:response regulator [Thermoanaerobaculia bacterium]
MIRLLLIDDNPDDRTLARRSVEREIPNLDIREVADLPELEQVLEEGDFDAVITDFQLRWTDGLAVLRAVRARYPQVPVVMFTNTGTEEVAVEAMKSGLDDYVIKAPRHYNRLPAALRAALRNRALEQERDQILEREREARAAAEAASVTKDEFLATLSHELRTPLNAIVGWAALLRSNTLQGQKLARAVASIERNARSLTRLIDDLLDVSAIISGKMSMEMLPLDLVSVLEASLDAIRPTAEARSIRLDATWEPDLGLVSGDPDRLQQVLWNLLSNAVKFTPPGGEVSAHLQKVEGNARLVVRDTGRGIDPAFLPHVFEPFRQADGSITRTHGGLGLGLAIVRRLVELHGGVVTAESAGLGEGATFTVELPLRIPPGDRRTQSPASPIENRPLSLAGLRVLAVDDDEEVRELLGAILGGHGAHVQAVASGAQALQLLESAPPDVLISDLAMPEMGGYELIHRVRQLPVEAGGRVPAVALTAYARAEDRRRTLLAGFHMHVAKPVDPEELVVVVASLTERFKAGGS